MVEYVLYWGVYIQWRNKFPDNLSAIRSAQEFAKSKDIPVSDLRLVKQVEIKL